MLADSLMWRCAVLIFKSKGSIGSLVTVACLYTYTVNTGHSGPAAEEELSAVLLQLNVTSNALMQKSI